MIVNAPKAIIHNNGVFKTITIRDLKQGWKEYAKGNTLHVATSSKITVEKKADCGIVVDKSKINLDLTINGKAKLTLYNHVILNSMEQQKNFLH